MAAVPRGVFLAEHHSIQLLPLMFRGTFLLPGLNGAGPSGGITEIISALEEFLINGELFRGGRVGTDMKCFGQRWAAFPWLLFAACRISPFSPGMKNLLIINNVRAGEGKKNQHSVTMYFEFLRNI